MQRAYSGSMTENQDGGSAHILSRYQGRADALSPGQCLIVFFSASGAELAQFAAESEAEVQSVFALWREARGVAALGQEYGRAYPEDWQGRPVYGGDLALLCGEDVFIWLPDVAVLRLWRPGRGTAAAAAAMPAETGHRGAAGSQDHKRGLSNVITLTGKR